VTTCAELKSALADTKAQVVALPVRGAVDCRTAARPQAACVVACKSDPSNPTYRVAVPNQSCAELDSTMSVMRTRNETQLNVRSNKTLLGRGATLRGASLNMSGSANVIVRDLVIEDVNPGLVEAGDGITLQNSHHVWIDHCRFKLVSDGHVDMTSSSNVTLSWNHFDGRNPAVCGGQHHYVHLVADSTVTFHHNFYDHTSGRNPKLDGAKTRGHLFNNHYLAISYFSIGASGSAEAKVENNFFDDARKPHWRDGGKVAASNNRYTGVSAAASEAKDTGDSVFGDVTMYPYTADPADGVPSNVDGHAGPR
jgi:pectate lyase